MVDHLRFLVRFELHLKRFAGFGFGFGFAAVFMLPKQQPAGIRSAWGVLLYHAYTPLRRVYVQNK
jgi:hypothetical protein